MPLVRRGRVLVSVAPLEVFLRGARVQAGCFLPTLQQQLALHLTLERSGTLVRVYHFADASYLTPLPALADTDPLGVNQNVTFEEVGGLDDCMLPNHSSFVSKTDCTPTQTSRLCKK